MSILITTDSTSGQIAAHIAATDPHGDRAAASIEARKIRNRTRMKQLRDDLSAAGVLTNLVWAQYFGTDGDACAINRGTQIGVDLRSGIYGLTKRQLVSLGASVTGDLSVVMQAGYASLHNAQGEFLVELRATTSAAGRVGFQKDTSNNYLFYSASNTVQTITLTGANTIDGAIMIGTVNAATNENIGYVNGVNVGSATYTHNDMAALINIGHSVDSTAQRVNLLGICMIFNRVLTPTEAATVTTAIRRAEGTRKLLLDGDSMGVTFAYVGSLYSNKTPMNLIRLFSEAGQKISTVTATAIAGTTPAQAIARFATDYAAVTPNSGQVAPIYLAWTGTNSLGTLTPAAILADLRTLWGLARAKGYEVLAVSLCRKAPYVTETLELNELIKADIGTYYDGYVDIDAEMVKDFGTSYNLNLTVTDGVHLKDHAAHQCFWRALDKNLHLFD